jgi:hypothetical protein
MACHNRRVSLTELLPISAAVVGFEPAERGLARSTVFETAAMTTLPRPHGVRTAPPKAGPFCYNSVGFGSALAVIRISPLPL